MKTMRELVKDTYLKLCDFFYFRNKKSWMEKLRFKWVEVPAGGARRLSTSQVSDNELLDYWNKAFNESQEVRKWYRIKYVNRLKGELVCDFGCGLGLDGIYFAEQGAKVCFADVVPDNVEVVKKICNMKQIDASFYVVEDLYDFHLPRIFDYVLLMGVILHVPFNVMQKELQVLSRFVKVGGHICVLAYPKERWIRDGKKPFNDWGKITDGFRTPWVEWYDSEKIQKLFGDSFQVEWWTNFHNNDDFNWFELVKKGE